MSEGSNNPREVLQRTVAALQTARANLTALQQRRTEQIAIIGAACRLPGRVDSLAAFAEFLYRGGNGIQDIPEGRWNVDRYFDPDPEAPGKTYARRIGALSDIAGFDAMFFGISPREAAAMGPQQRLLLEVAWEALEHAGIDPTGLEGSRSGVFIGICANDYGGATLDPSAIDIYTATGGSVSVAAGRISYHLGLGGPCMAVDTACSSSLVALHLAVESLRAGECDLALVGGVNLVVSPQLMLGMSKLRALSPRSRCASFADMADGYVRGEGCGVVVLKRLGDARAARDRVLAQIVATAVNQDGKSNGLTAPSGQAQERLIGDALARASLAPAQLDYVEAHGTGTALGDPIELRALDAVLGGHRTRPLVVGSVKSNIGHLEAAAGIAGLLKAILVVRDRAVPANLHASALTPDLDWARMNVVVPTSTCELARDRALHAGVSSFGFSGTNAHAIITGADDDVPPPAPGTAMLVLALSAKTPQALRELASRYRARIAGCSLAECRDVCFTATVHRAWLDARAVVVAETVEGLERSLTALAEDRSRTGVLVGRCAPDPGALAFVFSGHGGQWQGMGKQLMTLPEFAATVERCSDAMAPFLRRSIADLLRTDAASDGRVDLEQPMLFAMQVGLAELLRARAIAPELVVGHSVGEVAAAHFSGALGLDDAARIVCERSRVLQAIAGRGAMLFVPLDARAIADWLAENARTLEIAATNGPSHTVLSGDAAAIEAAERALLARNIQTKRIKVASAAHSRQLDDHLPELAGRLAGIAPASDAPIRFVSSVEGRALAPGALGPDYWVRNLRETVRFDAALEHIVASGAGAFVEIGPSPVLLDAVQAMVERADGSRLVAASLHRGGYAHRDLLELAGRLHIHGCRVDWKAFHVRGKIVDAPSYPWQHRRYWVVSDWDRAASPTAEDALIESSTSGEVIVERVADLGRTPWLAEHEVGGTPLMAAAWFLDAAASAALRRSGASACTYEDVVFETALEVRSDAAHRIQVVLRGSELRIASANQEREHARSPWTTHVRGRIVRDAASPAPPRGLEAAKQTCTQRIDAGAFYEGVRRRGFRYGPAFQTVAEVLVGPGEALARIRASVRGARHATTVVDPTVLDGCFQAVGALAGDDDGLWIPARIQSVTLSPIGGEVYAHVHGFAHDGNEQRADLDLYDASGARVATVRGLTSTRLDAARRDAAGHAWTYAVTWHERPLATRPGARAGRWIVIGSSRALTSSLHARLEAAGAVVSSFEPGVDDRLAAQLKDLATSDEPCRGIAYIAAPRAAELSVEGALSSSAGEALRVVQAVIEASLCPPARLWILTSGAQSISGEAVDPFQATLWGLGTALPAEHPELHTTLVDLGSAADLDHVASDLLSDADPERHVAWRAGRRWAARLEHAPLPSRSGHRRVRAAGKSFRLDIDEPGRLETLTLRSASIARPRANEVLVAVRAAGLNFADVMRAMGFFLDRSEQRVGLGTECAGEVLAVGSGVTKLRVGDRVACVATSCLATHVVASADLTYRLPATLDDRTAAGSPTAYMTACYALRHVARARPGQRILIHSASGGTGLAACAVARSCGLEILATAGTEAKRSFLRSQGVAHVFDSRSTDFEHEIQRLTGGGGVDVVLSSLTGAAIEAGLRTLAPDGIFLELGKRDIHAGALLSLASFKRRITYSAIDMAGLQVDRPQLFAQLFEEVMAGVACGELPALVSEAYPIARVREVFRRMAAGEHIGKLVVDLAGAADAEIALHRSELVSSDGCYLITGGLGDLGLALAQWLVEKGARDLALIGRHDPGADAALAIEALRARGARVTVARVDVACLAELRAMIERLRAEGRALRGVFHLAAVLRDGRVTAQSWDPLLEVCRPKVMGAWNLHVLTENVPLEHFVLYASTASILPSGGQATYAAANAFLDGLAEHRRARGLPATAISWGPFGDVGLAARQATTSGRLASRGVHSIRTRDAHAVLENILVSGRERCAVVALEPRAYLDAHPFAAAVPFYERLPDPRDAGAAESATSLDARRSLKTMAADEREPLLGSIVRDSVAAVLRLEPEEVPPDATFVELGVGSLASLELRSRLAGALDIVLPEAVLWKQPTVRTLLGYLLERYRAEDRRSAASDSSARK
ncbi:MAG TPA: type I polyketide synthase [Kofleriaceae bacterium]|nr:type I polyketide synthase [Kofleriaceae bacterium]